MTTLINIIDNLRIIGTTHRQINSYGIGYAEDICSSGTTNLPLMFTEPFGVIPQKGQVGFQFNIFILDLVQKGTNNRMDVYSDTNLIALDVLAKLREDGLGAGSTYKFELKQNETTFKQIRELVFDEEIAGWQMTLTLWVDWDWNKCATPFNS